MNTVIAHPSTTEEVNAIKAFMKALKIKFEVTPDPGQSPYNPEFVAKITQSKKEFTEGKVRRVKPDELQQFLGLP